jgi:UDP-3-O-[3-hydroxymyristoyl] glucosamine N-acyltransferase
VTLTAGAIAALVGGRVIGDRSRAVERPATLSAATPRDLSFVDDAKKWPDAESSRAGVIIAGPFAESSAREGATVICAQPRLAFARVARQLCPPVPPPRGIHRTAVVDPAVKSGQDVSIGPYAVIEAGVTLGDRVTIEAGVLIGRGVTIDADTTLKANVVVYAGTTIGRRVVVQAGTVLGSDGFGYVRDDATGRYEGFPQVGRLVIEDDVELGALCSVDRGALGETRIKRGTKLDNQVHVAHNVEIGEDVVIAAQTGVAGSSVIEDKVVVAGQVGIADHVRIGTGAILGAQAGVPTGKVIAGPGILFWGTPARPIKEYLKQLAVLARLARRQQKKDEG